MTVGSNDDESDAVRLDDGAGTLRLREVEKSAVISRRGVLWRAGLATAAGAAALTALDERRAEAASGGSFILGQSNDAASTSSLKVTNGTTVGLSYLMSLDGSAGVTQSTLQISGPSTGTGVFGSST
ncbi:MAG TPA: hypothetical protein VFJ98_08890, partial [Mycobacteriales bacterium]|nr:hypothetical protein [Mycobacteriales bacterium]